MGRAGITRSVIALLLGLLAAPARCGEPEIDWGDLRNITTSTQGPDQIVSFPADLRALNGKNVIVSGWITPINLGDGATITSFLLTGTPGTCPFCAGFGPESFILVSAAEPVPTDVTVQLLLSGRFEISPNDPTGFYYRLRQAHVIGHP
jgi:hypothetical protein